MNSRTIISCFTFFILACSTLPMAYPRYGKNCSECHKHTPQQPDLAAAKQVSEGRPRSRKKSKGLPTTVLQKEKHQVSDDDTKTTSSSNKKQKTTHDRGSEAGQEK